MRDASIRQVRKKLREGAFEEWANCRWQGYGVLHFKNNPKSNTYVVDKKKLSGSEWTNALKLNINYAPLRGVPGCQGDEGPLCRRCRRENETPAHVLGNCPNNMLLVTRRHHRVKHAVRELLEKKFTCFEEVYGVGDDGSRRYADIIAFSKDSNVAYVVDPTIRYESNDPEQAEKIDLEKRSIYEPCINFYQEKYREQFGDREFRVRGLWFGSRGTIPPRTLQFFHEVGVGERTIHDIVEDILSDSLAILNYHLYA